MSSTTGDFMPHMGVLNVHKPSGRTSRHVVNQVQRLVRPAKVGHAGTLDPLASGVLVVSVGQATRLIQYVQRMPKRYTGAFLLGRSSDTEDLEGTVRTLPNAPVPPREEIESALHAFIGTTEQMPPQFSALKIAGQRAFTLARRGQKAELRPRPITIYDLTLLHYEYPELVLDIRCSSGTYVRSLGRDLARRLNTEAVMSALVRTAIGNFTLDEAVPCGNLNDDTIAESLLPPIRAVEGMPTIELSKPEIAEVAHGRSIPRTDLPADTNEFVGLDAQGNLVAILTRPDERTLRPSRNFACPP